MGVKQVAAEGKRKVVRGANVAVVGYKNVVVPDKIVVGGVTIR